MRLHVVVQGRVQGVGYRWFVREAARRVSLAGWVRNLPDGSVEVAADGDDEAIQSFRGALRRGPPGAFVSSVDDAGPLNDELPNPFSIQR